MKAITRAISSAMQDCELTHLERQPLNLDVAQQQHANYNQTLREMGVEVIELAEQPTLPDSVFVEDTALVFDEIAIITHPGAPSRRPETASIAQALAPYRSLATLETPGILDGGDVLTIQKQVYVGLSSRSNQAAIEQLQQHLGPYGYTVHGLNMGQCLHLKTAVTALDDQTVLLNPRWIEPALFSDYKILETDTREPFGANVVRVGSQLLYGAGFPHTQNKIESLGQVVRTVDMSELAKAEGAVTCCSLLFN